MLLVTYDVNTSSSEGKSRLRHVSRICRNYGQRVQISVFECVVSPSQEALLKEELTCAIDPEHDSIRIYCLGSDYGSKVWTAGVDRALDLEGPLILRLIGSGHTSYGRLVSVRRLVGQIFFEIRKNNDDFVRDSIIYRFCI